MRPEIKESLKKTEPRIRKWFRHLHVNPELGFKEYETAGFVEEELKSFKNMEVERLGETGVLGRLKTGRSGPVFAFRADMDALPIEEDSSHELRSKNRGVMHACGHDGHTASLLGAAKILSDMKDELCGEVRFVFQPSEEVQPGGAKMMVREGALAGVDYIFGLHYSIDEEVGQFSIQEGPNFAANYKFDIRITGKEGHAAFPHLTSDSVLACAELVCALNRIVSRQISPASAAVLSVTAINGGNSYNSIPREMHIQGTFRFLEQPVGQAIISKIEEVGTGICSANRCQFTWNWEEGCIPLCNEPGLTRQIKTILENSYGTENVMGHEPVMGCEDFSEYLKHTNGVYYRVGARTTEADGTVFPTHNSGYRLNENALIYGTGSIVQVIEELAGKQ